MADTTLRGPATASSWLDRPLAPSRQQIAAIAAHWELIAYAAIVGIAFTLRLWDVGSRAVHHDESLHAYYAWKLFVGQGYSYDPLMHGPFQFEVIPFFYLLFGASEFSARLLAVILGTGLVGLPFFVRSHLTRGGALIASGLLAISPAFVYFSRFVRDDMYLAFFSLGLFVCIARYLEFRQPRYMYIGAACVAFAVASMEAAYLTIFIFGSFLAFEALREFVTDRDGPVITAVRNTNLDTWLTAVSICVVLTVLMYSTFFTNPSGVWDSMHSLTSASRTDILGGITYWQAQHGVARGDQPWFYYLLVLPLYEQAAVAFGLAGLVYAVLRRSLITTFLLWWAVMSLGVYSWAGEKMPWLTIHIALPFVLLAGLFMGAVLNSRRVWALAAAGTSFAILLVLEIHSTFALNFQNGANPTEMLIYVQTSQDVPRVAQEIGQLSQRVTGGKNLQIGLDTTDLGGWPFIWYLRDYPKVTETTSFNGPACNGTYCPALLILGPEYDQNAAFLSKHYVAQKYRWNWWFPEDYKTWFPEHVGTIPLALGGHGAVATDPFGVPSDWQNLWRWLVYRTPFADRSARWLYFLVRRDLVPNVKQFPTRPLVPGLTGPQGVSANVPSLPAIVKSTTGGPRSLSGPRGIAAGPGGTIVVADTRNHRVVVMGQSGKVIRTFGQEGASPGQFNHVDSPQAVAVGPDHNIYVADTWNQRIQVFSPAGTFLRMWGGGGISAQPGHFYGPRSIAISPAGRVYVADTGNKRVQIFDLKGKYINEFGTSGSGEGQFQEPSAVAVGDSGKVFVADFWNQRIQVFSATGQYLRQWPVPDWTPQSYDEPFLSVSRGANAVFAADPRQQRVLVYSSTGKLLGAFGSASMSMPIGVAALPGSRVQVADAAANTITTYQIGRMPAGTLPVRPARRTSQPAPGQNPRNGRSSGSP